MKKTLLLLSVLLATACVTNAQQSTYLNCKMDGKPYTIAEENINTYTALKGPTVPAEKVVRVYTSQFGGDAVNFDFSIFLAKDGTLKPGKYPLGTMDAYKKTPSANFEVTETVGDNYLFYGTETAADGTLEVTSVTGDWVEGTFVINIPQKYGPGKRAITDGRFRFRMEPAKVIE